MLEQMLWMTVFHAVIFGSVMLVVLWVSRRLARADRVCHKCGGSHDT